MYRSNMESSANRGVFRTELNIFTKIVNDSKLSTAFAKRLYHKCSTGFPNTPLGSFLDISLFSAIT